MGTRWSPDTCECVIDVADWSSPSAAGNVFIRRCAEHAALPPASAHSAVHAENRTITGDLIARLSSAFPAVAAALANGSVSLVKFRRPPTRMSADDQSALAALRSAHVCLYIDAGRVVHLTCPMLNTQQKASLQNTANTRYGAGKVVIE